ncbi:MAG: M12 family metallo-peptidase [Planctomycetota bacterium]|nr:M12 family metallo-peptidase [Planctomycetota bacterium]
MPHSSRVCAALLALLALVGCGGGGGGGGGPTTINLGTFASTVPTPVPQTFVNPLTSAATITQIATVGPFAIDPADLPAQAPARGAVELDVIFDPQGPGAAAGTITLEYAGGGLAVPVTYAYQATAESVIWSVLTPTLDFGLVDVGQALDLVATIQNASSLSPVTLTSATLPSGDFSIVGNPFPLTLNAGDVGSVTLRYAPQEGGTDNGNLVLGPFDAGGPVTIQVLAASPGGGQEDITDFGAQSFVGGLTPTLNVTVPSDAISLTIECLGAPGQGFGLGELTGPGGKVYENLASTGAYVWVPGVQAFSTTVPNTDRTNVQLVPGGGTYSFRVRRFSGSGTAQVRAIVERRPGGVATGGVLPLNIFLAEGLSVSAATAATDTRLQSILSSMEQILSQQGISLGDIDYYDMTDPAYNVVSESEFPTMLATWTAQASETRMNLFFVQTAIGGGVVGVSAALSGPKQNGTAVSGAMSVYSGFSTGTVGLIAAHELGHFLGLYHTVEQNGQHDFIDDTAECLPSGTNAACSVSGGGYLMHWQAVGGTDITDGQGLVINCHPLMEPSATGSTKPGGGFGASGALVAPTDAWQLPQGWCGTCAQAGLGR